MWQNPREKTSVVESFLNKTAGINSNPAALLKGSSPQRGFLEDA